MIITAQEFFDSGIPVASDIAENEVTFAISTVEQMYMRPRIGNEKWADMAANPGNYYIELNGGVTVPGLKAAMYHLVMAYMMYDKIRLTRYTPVMKNDEHSTEPSISEIKAIASQHWEIGECFAKDVLDYMQIKDNGCRNNLIFDELLYPPTRSSHKQVR